MTRHKYSASLKFLSVLLSSTSKWLELNDFVAHTKSKNKNKYYQIIRRLVADGLVEKVKKGKNIKIAITTKGRKAVNKWTREAHSSLIPELYSNDLSQSNVVVIVIFDIPERLKLRRYQIREVLRALEFKMIQKSVWMGRNKIPSNFIKDLKSLGLLIYVDIFSVDKSGSLKSIL